MSETEDDVKPESPAGKKLAKNWPLMRKVEALVFLAMFLAVPLFALRVLQYTHSQLEVRNVTRQLVHDLGRFKTMAITLKTDVEVIGNASKDKYQNHCSYAISTPKGIAEEIVLPENVSVVGNVIFTQTGRPEKASSFIVSSFNRNLTVEIDKQGLVTVP